MDSYARHRLDEEAQAERQSLPTRFSAPESIDNWHHERMLGALAPLLAHSAGTRWMTVGDGRFGSDANFLMDHVASVTATSISDSTLAFAKDKGWVTDYSAENIEALSFGDDSFDWVLCKESYHHLPRPAVGFYEMLRVARVGVALIEPVDAGGGLFHPVKAWVKKAVRGDGAYADDQFEPVGNFIFRVSIGEIAKMMTALNYRTVAWRTMNTFWSERLAAAPKDKPSLAWYATRAGILAQDAACGLRLLAPGLGIVLCFKQDPAPELTAALRAGGFRVETLPRNPYLPAAAEAGPAEEEAPPPPPQPAEVQPPAQPAEAQPVKAPQPADA